MSFEFLDHPADIGFRAFGSSLEDLFANCGHALLAIILDPAHVAPAQSWEINAEASDLESLLVNWLNELLYYVDTRRIAFHRFAVSFTQGFEVRCIASGEPRDPVKHPVRLSVKAVTYHQLRVSKTGETWLAEVYVDV
jgi:SHS2 domain-containing protein